MILSSQRERFMIVSDFTVPELELFREKCNFTRNEMPIFEMRSRGIPLEEIAEALDMSVENVKRISRKVNNKIIRITTL